MAIDGFPSAGKTPLGRLLSKELEFTHIDLDEFLIPDLGAFLPAIKLPEIRKRIDDASGNMIISGCCILEVLDKLAVTPGLLIYVKRVGQNGIWYEGNYAEGALLPAQEMAKVSGYPLNEFDAEIEQYHRNWRPDLRARLIVNLPDAG